MNKISYPGFTAEDSLYKRSQPYAMAATFEALEASPKLYLQRVRDPGGPIGLPGQNCGEACLHICIMSGVNMQACVNRCLSTCTGSPLEAITF
jgi:hypothetical protein